MVAGDGLFGTRIGSVDRTDRILVVEEDVLKSCKPLADLCILQSGEVDMEVFAPELPHETRLGLVWRVHRPSIAVSFIPYHGQAVFEGDIILGPSEELQRRYREHIAEMETLASETPVGSAEAKAVSRAARLAEGGIDPLWPGAAVPFLIEPSLSSKMRRRIDDAIQQWQMHTHVRFRERGPEPDYIIFRRWSGCGSLVGRVGGPQFVDIVDEASTGNIMHELGHVVGLWHEHSRDDRDDFITIHLDNVPPILRVNFSQHIVDGDDVGDYDFDSIMHYPADAFAIDPSKPTITVTSGRPIGQREKLSRGDVEAVKILYS